MRAVFSPAAQQTGAAVAWKEDGVDECNTSGSPCCAVVAARNDPYIPKFRTLGVPLVLSHESKGAIFARIRHRQPAVHCPESDLVPRRVSLDVTQVRNDVSSSETSKASPVGAPASSLRNERSTATPLDMQKLQKKRARLQEISRRSMELQKDPSTLTQANVAKVAGSKRAATPSSAVMRKRARTTPEAFLSQALEEEDSVIDDELTEDEEDEELTEEEESNQVPTPARRSSRPSRTPVQGSRARESAAASGTPSTPARAPELQKALETFNRLSARRQRIREHMAKTSSARPPANSKEMLNKKLAKAARLKALAKK